MATALENLPNDLGVFLIEGVRSIDSQCCKIQDGVECGLAYIKEQFAEEAMRETGKKLTEELLISWLLSARLRKSGMRVESEACYSGSRQKCDLVIQMPDDSAFAIEVKMAWKKWVWTDGSVRTSSAFKGYLLGDASHRGTAHDFDKLQNTMWPRSTWLGVLLIGFDSFVAPIDDKIAELETRQDLRRRGWELNAHQAWPDRKNADYRIACWFWRHAPLVARHELGGAVHTSEGS